MSTAETFDPAQWAKEFTDVIGELSEAIGKTFIYTQTEVEREAFTELSLDESPAYPDGTEVRLVGATDENDDPNGIVWIQVEPVDGSSPYMSVHISSILGDRPTPDVIGLTDDPPPEIPDAPATASQPKIDGRTYSPEEIKSIIEKDKRQSALAQTILEMEGQAQLDQAELNDLRSRIKDKHRELAEMAVNPPQTTIDFGTSKKDEDRDPAMLTPSELGAQAAAQGRGIDECPYGDSLPEWQSEWLAAHDAASKADSVPWKGKENEMLMSAAGMTAEKCAELLKETDKLIWPATGAEIPKLSAEQKAVALFERPHLVVDTLAEGEGYALAPLYTADEWTASGADIGDPVDRSTQEGFHDYQIHGILCGRRVKHGAKKLIIGPERDFVHLVVDKGEEATEENLFA